MSSILSCQNISKSFCTNNGSIDALKNISFSVAEGQWIGIYGRNGSGKTTLLSTLAELLRPDTGTVTINGTLAAFFGIGTGFHHERTAAENLKLYYMLHGVPHHIIKNLIHTTLSFTDIPETHHQLPIKMWSTGMRLRLGFAATTSINCDIYLFDEIAAVGDELFRQKCAERFTALREQHKTVIMAFHSRKQIERWCDAFYRMENGILIAADAMQALHAS